MPQQYTYLLLDVLSVLFPFLLSFDKKVAFYKNFYRLFPSIAITATVFIVWDIWFTISGVWSFSEIYTLPIRLWSLPIEEILFFICVPYACIFTYEVFKTYFPTGADFKYASQTHLILLPFFILVILLYYNQLYTTIATSVSLALAIIVQYIKPLKWLGYFYTGYFISLIPFLIINGILTSLPVVSYNPAENTGFRILTIPIEDSAYLYAMLLMNILLYEEVFKKKN